MLHVCSLPAVSPNNRLLRNSVFELLKIYIVRGIKKVFCARDDSSLTGGEDEQEEIRPAQSLSRFHLIVQAVKPELSFFVPTFLVFIKLTGFAFTLGAVPGDTDDVMQLIICDWDVIGLILVGEVFGDGLTVGLQGIISRCLPSLYVVLPKPEDVVMADRTLFNFTMMIMNISHGVFGVAGTAGALQSALEEEYGGG